MNETQKNQLINTVAQTSETPKRHGKSWWFVVLLGTVSVVVIIGYLGWQQFMRSQQELHQELETLQNQVTTLESEFQALLSETEEEQGPSDQIEAEIESVLEQLQQLNKQQVTLATQMRQPRPRSEDWVLAETIYLVTLAHYQLKFAHNSANALTILKEVDANLSQLPQPAVQEIRTALATEMQNLSQMNRPDLNEWEAQLTHFATLAESLPLLQGSRQLVQANTSVTPNSSASVTWQDWVAVAWQQVKQLVVIRYSDEADRGLLSTEQREFVTQSLRLKLDMAKVSLWRHDTRNFKAAIQETRTWLTHYYDPADQAVKRLQEDLAKMQQQELSPKLPELTSILQQLQQLLVANFSPTSPSVTPP